MKLTDEQRAALTELAFNAERELASTRWPDLPAWIVQFILSIFEVIMEEKQ